MEKKKGFQKRESSDWHNYGALARYVTAPATVVGDIGGLLSERHAESTSSRKSRDH